MHFTITQKNKFLNKFGAPKKLIKIRWTKNVTADFSWFYWFLLQVQYHRYLVHHNCLVSHRWRHHSFSSLVRLEHRVQSQYNNCLYQFQQVFMKDIDFTFAWYTGLYGAKTSIIDLNIVVWTNFLSYIIFSQSRSVSKQNARKSCLSYVWLI